VGHRDAILLVSPARLRYALTAVTVHLLKLCVGIDSVEQLAEFQARRLAAGERLVHRTRHFPRRAAEILEGGSIYWVIRGFVRVRQRIIGLERATSEERGPHCCILRDPELVRTELQPRRPHQGWRYLEPGDAPPDLPAGRAAADAPPPGMAEELRALGLI